VGVLEEVVSHLLSWLEDGKNIMKFASDPDINYKELVREGYDRCAQAYAASRQADANPELSILIERLPPNATVLDIGCGGGIPVCQQLAKCASVTGIDISAAMVALARENVPSAEFTCSDIMQLEFPASSFDAVTSFYAIFHLPKEEHEELFRRIHLWLKPKGYLMSTLAKFDEAPYTEDGFFDVTMYWSNYGISRYREMLISLGFLILEDTRVGHGYRSGVTEVQEAHPLIFAQKE
tara:strand:+ start:17483 stop:18193 length:711 start_codon:yes stop_codon:yes gene_type:complete